MLIINWNGIVQIVLLTIFIHRVCIIEYLQIRMSLGQHQIIPFDFHFVCQHHITELDLYIV